MADDRMLVEVELAPRSRLLKTFQLKLSFSLFIFVNLGFVSVSVSPLSRGYVLLGCTMNQSWYNGGGLFEYWL